MTLLISDEFVARTGSLYDEKKGQKDLNTL